MKLNHLKTDTEIVRRKTRLSRIREKTSGSVNQILLATQEAKEANRAAMARQMAKENQFETFKAW
jgi:hypothetical protein